MHSEPILISDVEVAAVLTPEIANEAVASALAAHAKRLCVQPLKLYLRPGGRENENERGRLICMPACKNGDDPILGVKVISGFPKNPERGLPRASGIVMLCDYDTGRPIAIMDCQTLSARRTAAVATVCWNYFGYPDDTIAIIGCGPINHEVVLAINARKKPVRQFRVYDLNRERADNFRRSLAWQLDCEIRVFPDLESCIRGAATVITATSGQNAKGYIDPAWLHSAKLLVPLSLDDFRPETVLAADKIVVDDFDQCNREEKLFHKLIRGGRLRREQIYAELGEIVVGAKPGRTGNEVVFANLMGMGIEDIAVANLVYKIVVGNRQPS
jgi:ornithine cyclodeaminase